MLTGSGDVRTTLAGMDEIYDPAQPPAGEGSTARLGRLRDRVLGHLGDHPGASFTQHEIHKVLNSVRDFARKEWPFGQSG